MHAYFVSGVWKDDSGVIINLFVHFVEKEKDGIYYFNHGKKQSVVATINDISENENDYYVIVWDYSEPGWIVCRKINIVEANPPYLRSTADKTKRDNLDNLIEMKSIA